MIINRGFRLAPRPTSQAPPVSDPWRVLFRSPAWQINRIAVQQVERATLRYAIRSRAQRKHNYLRLAARSREADPARGVTTSRGWLTTVTFHFGIGRRGSRRDPTIHGGSYTDESYGLRMRIDTATYSRDDRFVIRPFLAFYPWTIRSSAH